MRFIIPLTSVTAVSAIAIFKDGSAIFKDTFRQVESILKETRHFASQTINAIEEAKERIQIEFEDTFADDTDDNGDESIYGRFRDSEDLDLSNFTIYDFIAESNETSKFFNLVKRFDDVVKLLNDTENQYTLFVPLDKAFENLPPHEQPSDEVIHNALLYHIGIGNYSTRQIISTHTLPSALDEPFLDGNPQRLRTSFGLSGVRVNVYSKVVLSNIKAKNGYIHAVSNILVPPTMIGRLISFFPAQFSTLLLAYEKTDFVKYIHNIKMVGSTVFAPTNKAWERLGPRANAFLFNTEQGKKYLTALLKYQIVPNTTVYSDEIYFGGEGMRLPVEDLVNKDGHFHIELPTLLEKGISVDIYNWKLWTSIVVNGAVKVGFIDGIGKNGVIQVVEDIVVPHGKAGDGQIEVKDLKRRLKNYVEDVSNDEQVQYDEGVQDDEGLQYDVEFGDL